jgi:aminoglycoside 3-N-acetyltransferase
VIRTLLSRYLPREQKHALKAVYNGIKSRTIRLLASYTPAQLEAKFRELGIAQNHAVLMHASFGQFTGFRGEPWRVIDCLLKVLGPGGHLFMMSMAYTSSALDYLKSGAPFDVRRTVSRMGIISEAFRRRDGVLRSANSLHPVLAWGPKAEWVISRHDQMMHSCGAGSPFGKMLELDTKVLFFDVPFAVLTFAHYLEDRFKDSAPVPVYHPEPFQSLLIDRDGREQRVKVYAFHRNAIERRNFPVLEEALIRDGLLRRDKIGNTGLMIVKMTDALKHAQRLVDQGTHFYRR